MGYIAYQALSKGHRVMSKTKVRKSLRHHGLGRGGCTPAPPFSTGTISYQTPAPTSTRSSYGGTGIASASRSSEALPTGWKGTVDPYVAYCHNNHRSHYLSPVAIGDKLTCKDCGEKFVVRD